MDAKTAGESLQEIEFVLFQLWSKSTVHAGEIETAWENARKVMEEYFLPLGAYRED